MLRYEKKQKTRKNACLLERSGVTMNRKTNNVIYEIPRLSTLKRRPLLTKERAGRRPGEVNPA